MNDLSLSVHDLAESARARASLFAFLNLHFTNLPDQNFVKHVRDHNFRTALEELKETETDNTDLSTGANLMLNYLYSSSEMDAELLSNALGVDRTRLYRGISPSYGPPPPYEAVWLKRSQNVPLVLRTIAGIYQEDGMAVSPNAKDRLDYVGVEMDYLYQLAMREAQAWDTENEVQARQLLDRQDTFLREHLGEWIPAFVEKALTMAETDFYRGHLKMLRGFLTGEQDRVRALLNEMSVVA